MRALAAVAALASAKTTAPVSAGMQRMRMDSTASPLADISHMDLSPATIIDGATESHAMLLPPGALYGKRVLRRQLQASRRIQAWRRALAAWRDEEERGASAGLAQQLAEVA